MYWRMWSERLRYMIVLENVVRKVEVYDCIGECGQKD